MLQTFIQSSCQFHILLITDWNDPGIDLAPLNQLLPGIICRRIITYNKLPVSKSLHTNRRYCLVHSVRTIINTHNNRYLRPVPYYTSHLFTFFTVTRFCHIIYLVILSFYIFHYKKGFLCRQLLFCDFIEYFHGSQEDFTVTCLFFQQ